MLNLHFLTFLRIFQDLEAQLVRVCRDQRASHLGAIRAAHKRILQDFLCVVLGRFVHRLTTGYLVLRLYRKVKWFVN